MPQSILLMSCPHCLKVVSTLAALSHAITLTESHPQLIEKVSKVFFFPLSIKPTAKAHSILLLMLRIRCDVVFLGHCGPAFGGGPRRHRPSRSHPIPHPPTPEYIHRWCQLVVLYMLLCVFPLSLCVLTSWLSTCKVTTFSFCIRTSISRDPNYSAVKTQARMCNFIASMTSLNPRV